MLGLTIFLTIAFLPAVSGVVVQPGGWYATLAKPAWTPPNWLFGPAWTVLYFLIGCAGFLAWSAVEGAQRRRVFSVYAAQLVLNGLWTVIFFGMHEPVWALVELVLLWVCIAANGVMFARIRPAAGLLMVPYLAWVTFAGCLNAAIVWLNGR